MIRAYFDGETVTPITELDARELERAFPSGNVRLNSDNCPEIAAEIKRLSDILLEQNKEAYDGLARYD